MAAVAGITVHEWARRFNEIQFSAFPFKVETQAQATADGALVHAMAWVDVKNINDTKPLRVMFSEQVSAWQLSAVTPHEAFRRVVTQLVQHEIDECIVIRGIRPFDPHRGEAAEEVP